MRVLILTNMYPPHHLGGYELSCRDVVERWRRAGHDVHVLTSDLTLPGVSTPADDRVRRDLRIYWRDGTIFHPGPRTSLRIEQHNIRVVGETLDALRPDVVSAWHMGAMSLSALMKVHDRRIPLVLVVCDDWMIYGPKVDAWGRRVPWRRRSLSRVGEKAVACFVSTYIRDRALARSPVKPATSTVVPSGIDTDDFPIASPELRPWSDRLLCVGRIEERKGVHVAIEALAKLPEMSLTVSGPGEDAELGRLRDVARNAGVADRVTFTLTPRSELRTLYASADAFLFPVTWDEPFGLTPLEAMACATPVVGTVRAGSRDFLADGTNCLAVESGDPAALAAAIERLRADDTLRERLVRGGVETAATYTADRYARTLEAWHLWAAGKRTERPD